MTTINQTTNNHTRLLEPEEVAFISYIREYPTDATARLAFADWCDEHGQPQRAKYLREIRPHKFTRRVRNNGALYAVYPEHLNQMPPHRHKLHYKMRHRAWVQPDKPRPINGFTASAELLRLMKEIELASVGGSVTFDTVPLVGHPKDQPYTERCKAWVDKIHRGWKLPKHIRNYGYSMAVRYFGVLTWEYLDVLAPLISKRYNGLE